MPSRLTTVICQRTGRALDWLTECRLIDPGYLVRRFNSRYGTPDPRPREGVTHDS